MSAGTKLASFAGLLAAVFAGALLVGSNFDLGSADAEPAAGMAGHGEDDAAPQAVRGLAVSEHGLTLELARRTAPRDRTVELSFRIADRRGRTVRDFDVEHAKRMHLIVARRDLTGFQHLHPVQGDGGRWSVSLRLPDPGSYRVFADFSVDGKPYTLAGDLTVDGPVRSRELPSPAPSVEVDGMRVELDAPAAAPGDEAELAFTVTRAGRPVEVEPYLGAKGHLVALRRGDLAFLHVHPDEDRLQFGAAFPSVGSYRLFLQFKTRDGRIHTAAFTREVSR